MDFREQYRTIKRDVFKYLVLESGLQWITKGCYPGLKRVMIDV